MTISIKNTETQSMFVKAAHKNKENQINLKNVVFAKHNLLQKVN